MTVRTATGLIACYMRACGFAGWASFWRVIYVLPGHENDQRLLRHERCHLEQIERDGRAVAVQHQVPVVAVPLRVLEQPLRGRGESSRKSSSRLVKNATIASSSTKRKSE